METKSENPLPSQKRNVVAVIEKVRTNKTKEIDCSIAREFVKGNIDLCTMTEMLREKHGFTKEAVKLIIEAVLDEKISDDILIVMVENNYTFANCFARLIAKVFRKSEKVFVLMMDKHYELSDDTKDLIVQYFIAGEISERAFRRMMEKRYRLSKHAEHNIVCATVEGKISEEILKFWIRRRHHFSPGEMKNILIPAVYEGMLSSEVGEMIKNFGYYRRCS